MSLLAAVLIIGGSLVYRATRSSPRSPARSSNFALNLDPGTPLRGPAPAFTLRDQFDRTVSLRDFRGKAVILAFNDSECTTVCPLTTTAMVEAQRLLGPAAAHVALLGIDANPSATSIADVRAYSELHGMTHLWHFLTGSLAQLKQVWKAYSIDVAIERGQIDHTPALYVIDPSGRLAKVYLTQMAYSTVEQQAALLAQEVASLLPGHPRVATSVSYAQIPTTPPTAHAQLPRAGGGSIALGPGRARLLAFFATWDSEVTDLAGRLKALGGYARTAAARGLPALVAVDEATVEPSPAALTRFLGELGPLPYPVGIDRDGRLADGYGVQDEPWYVLVSGSGKILWYYDVATSGWLSTRSLIAHVRAALAQPAAIASQTAIRAQLAGSPPPLAALHAQAGQLLGGTPALMARLRALRGYPVVVNVWASWCGPCQAEFGIFASASVRYGRRVAFLGVNANDEPQAARAFLGQHPVSYPSYQSATPALSGLAIVQGLPTTIFIDRSGKVVSVHSGQYNTEGSLDEDIAGYALGGS